jgi:PPOX class probable FMN-dependent enzyme
MGRFVGLCLTSHGLLKTLIGASSFTPRQIFSRSNKPVQRVMMASSSSIGLGDVGKATGEEDIISWRSRIDVSIGQSRKIRGGNYVQIATVDSETTEPRCRTVVFRGFQEVKDGNIECDDKPCVIKMITDNRSNKVLEATNGNSACELVWWFSKSSEQYRIRGKLRFVGGGQFELDEQMASVRKQQWGNLSDLAREQFFWKEPGLSYSGESSVPEGGRDEEGKVLPPPDSFLLMLLYPTRVDYLRLGDNFRQIDQVTGGVWTQSRVNP